MDDIRKLSYNGNFYGMVIGSAIDFVIFAFVIFVFTKKVLREEIVIKRNLGGSVIKKIFVGFAITLILFLGFVSTRDGHFNYERSGVIHAPASAIFAYISDFKKGTLWNPFDQKDPNMKRTFLGPDAQVGSTMVFEGNREGGTGKLEILKLVPDQSVDIRLTMTSPMSADNVIHYQLTPEGDGTRFSWEMSGDGGFMAKLISLFMNCEKFVTPEFETGIKNLKAIVEAQKPIRMPAQ